MTIVPKAGDRVVDDRNGHCYYAAPYRPYYVVPSIESIEILVTASGMDLKFVSDDGARRKWLVVDRT